MTEDFNTELRAVKANPELFILYIYKKLERIEKRLRLEE